MLLYAGIFLVLSNAVTSRRDKSILYSRIVIAMLICSIFLSVNSLNLEFINNGIGILGGLYNITVINLSFHIIILILTSLILQLNGFYPRKVWKKELSTITGLIFNRLVYYNNFILNKMSAQYKIIEYPLIILFIVIGTTFLVASSDLVSLFLAIELQSYGLYILCSVYRNSERSISGGLTYFLLGGLSSTFIILASSLLYGNSGNTSFDNLYVINNISNIVTETRSYGWYDSYYFSFSLIIMSVGLLFKVSAAPFHFWSPDVYDAIPTVVTTFVAIIAKISLFILLLELVHFTTGFFQHDNFSWTITLLISSMLSLIVGSVLGLTQFRIKRLYAYSTISHVGFILLALTVNTVESIQSFIFYLIQYSICNLNAFLILILIGYSLYCYVEIQGKDRSISSNLENNQQLLDKSNSPIQLVRQLKGYFNINSYLALSLTITLFSFVGIPPLIGFFAKQMVLTSALDNGYVFITFIAILTSVISAYYYLALIKQMFFHKSDYQLNSSLQNMTSTASIENKTNNYAKNTLIIDINDIKLSSALTTTVSLLTLVILLFIIIPNEWLNMANILSLILFSI